MCTTSQYLYVCSHPASYRFRTSICLNPASSSCRIRDDNSVLPYTCSKCAPERRVRNAKQGGKPIMQTTDMNIMVARKTWYIPSRCFIDTGFQNLNPFGSGIEVDSHENARPRSPLSPISRLPLNKNGRGAGFSATKQPRHPSPCCLKSRRTGAYQATRLEGLEDRQRGRIVDSFCGSYL